MTLPRAALLAALAVFLAVRPTFAIDEFDRHSAEVVKKAAGAIAPQPQLTMRQAAELNTLGPGVVKPCIVVQTNGGHWTKALLSWGLRKGAEKPTPVLIIERYVTYDREKGEQTLSSGKNVILFPGFQFNFDLGQVVPADQAPDVEFTPERALKTVGSAKIFPLNGSAVPPAPTNPEEYDPSAVKEVTPRDFAGVWRLNADGRWLGVMQLAVDSEGKIKGMYTAEETQAGYKVRGRISGEPHRVLLEVEFPNAVQEFEGYLWTSDKSIIAGSTLMVDRKFGFFAVRETDKADASAAGAAGEKTPPTGEPNAIAPTTGESAPNPPNPAPRNPASPPGENPPTPTPPKPAE